MTSTTRAIAYTYDPLGRLTVWAIHQGSEITSSIGATQAGQSHLNRFSAQKCQITEFAMPKVPPGGRNRVILEHGKPSNVPADMAAQLGGSATSLNSGPKVAQIALLDQFLAAEIKMRLPWLPRLLCNLMTLLYTIVRWFQNSCNPGGSNGQTVCVHRDVLE